MPDRFDDLANCRGDVFGSLKVHIVAAVDEDLSAVGGKLSQLGLTISAISFQLSGRNVQIVIESTFRTGEHYERNRP